MTITKALHILAFSQPFYRYGLLQRGEIMAAWLFLNPNPMAIIAFRQTRHSAVCLQAKNRA